MSENIYPELEERNKFINDYDINDYLNQTDRPNLDDRGLQEDKLQDASANLRDLKQKLANLRIVDFESDLGYLEEKIKHYNKIYRRWKNFDSGVRYTDIIIGALIGGTSIALISLGSFGIMIPVIVTAGITAGPLAYSVFHGILIGSVIKSRRNKYHNLVLKITEIKDKLFLFHRKALNDDILTDEEISVSKSMVKEVKELIKNESKLAEAEMNKKADLLLKELDALKEKVRVQNMGPSGISIRQKIN